MHQGGTFGWGKKATTYAQYMDGRRSLEDYEHRSQYFQWNLNPKTFPTDNNIRKFFTYAPRSDHPNGLHVSMVDGSVHFVSEETERIVMDSLASRDRGDGYNPSDAN